MIAPIINNVPPKKVLSVIPPIMGPAKNITNPIVDTGLLKKEPFTLPKSSLPNSSSIISLSTFFFTIVRLSFFFMSGALGQTRTGTPKRHGF